MIVTALVTLSCARRRRWRPAGIAMMSVLAATMALIDARQAQAQSLNFQTQLRPTPPRAPDSGDPQMLVQATEIQYDYPNERVVAVGNVQIYYKGSTVQADKIIYDQRTKHLQAEGNVRLTSPEGVITYGDLIDLSDDLRNGFIDSLRLETAEQTRFAAARATRTEGNYTVLESGVYTACEPCRTDPRKPPLWQVKAARIIHDQTEKMIYFEDARIEFFGVPLAYSPYLAAPDPTVKRKSGFLMPLITTNSIYGVGVETPYYLALAPSYDMTSSPRVMSKQGPLLQAEWRQRLEDGSYTIRGAGQPHIAFGVEMLRSLVVDDLVGLDRRSLVVDLHVSDRQHPLVGIVVLDFGGLHEHRRIAGFRLARRRGWPDLALEGEVLRLRPVRAGERRRGREGKNYRKAGGSPPPTPNRGEGDERGHDQPSS